MHYLTRKDHQPSFGQSAQLTLTGLSYTTLWCTPLKHSQLIKRMSSQSSTIHTSQIGISHPSCRTGSTIGCTRHSMLNGTGVDTNTKLVVAHNAHGCVKLKNISSVCTLAEKAAVGWLAFNRHQDDTDVVNDKWLIQEGQVAKTAVLEYADLQ